MSDMNAWLATAIAWIGVVSSGIVAYLAYSLSKQAQRSQIQQSISDLYNKMTDYRSAHPEVMALSRRWEPRYFETLYHAVSDEDRAWILYYTYAEWCISFCNAVLSARRSHLLNQHVYEGQYKPLVKLLMTENEPFIASVLSPGKYISAYMKDFRLEMEKEGWDWDQMHNELASSGDPVAVT
jgi:type II secretory pathway pseudopilin PulG